MKNIYTQIKFNFTKIKSKIQGFLDNIELIRKRARSVLNGYTHSRSEMPMKLISNREQDITKGNLASDSGELDTTRGNSRGNEKYVTDRTQTKNKSGPAVNKVGHISTELNKFPNLIIRDIDPVKSWTITIDDNIRSTCIQKQLYIYNIYNHSINISQKINKLRSMKYNTTPHKNNVFCNLDKLYRKSMSEDDRSNKIMDSDSEMLKQRLINNIKMLNSQKENQVKLQAETTKLSKEFLQETGRIKAKPQAVNKTSQSQNTEDTNEVPAITKRKYTRRNKNNKNAVLKDSDNSQAEESEKKKGRTRNKRAAATALESDAILKKDKIDVDKGEIEKPKSWYIPLNHEEEGSIGRITNETFKLPRLPFEKETLTNVFNSQLDQLNQPPRKANILTELRICKSSTIANQLNAADSESSRTHIELDGSVNNESRISSLYDGSTNDSSQWSEVREKIKKLPVRLQNIAYRELSFHKEKSTPNATINEGPIENSKGEEIYNMLDTNTWTQNKVNKEQSPVLNMEHSFNVIFEKKGHSNRTSTAKKAEMEGIELARASNNHMDGIKTYDRIEVIGEHINADDISDNDIEEEDIQAVETARGPDKSLEGEKSFERIIEDDPLNRVNNPTQSSVDEAQSQYNRLRNASDPNRLSIRGGQVGQPNSNLLINSSQQRPNVTNASQSNANPTLVGANTNQGNHNAAATNQQDNTTRTDNNDMGLPSEGHKNGSKEGEDITFRTVILMKEKAAVEFDNRLKLAREIEKYIKIGDNMYKAFIKQDQLHIMCRDADLDAQFKTAWKPEAFDQGLIGLIEDVEMFNNQKLMAYANIKWNLNEEEIEVLDKKYSIPRRNINQIKNNTFTLEFTNKQLYNQAMQKEMIQLGSEPIKLYKPGKRENNVRLMQCFKCQKFGHYHTFCKAKQETCKFCGKEHSSKQCDVVEDRSKWRCSNCGCNDENPHEAGSKSCPKYIEEHAKAVDRINSKNKEGKPAKDNATTLRKEDLDKALEDVVTKDKLAKVLREYNDRITTYVKHCCYDKHMKLAATSELEKLLFDREAKLMIRIDPINQDELFSNLNA